MKIQNRICLLPGLSSSLDREGESRHQGPNDPRLLPGEEPQKLKMYVLLV